MSAQPSPTPVPVPSAAQPSPTSVPTDATLGTGASKATVPELAAALNLPYKLTTETGISPAFAAVLDAVGFRTADGALLSQRPVAEIIARTQEVFFKKAPDANAAAIRCDEVTGGPIDPTVTYSFETRMRYERTGPIPDALRPFFINVGLLETINPVGRRFDEAIVAGGTAFAIELRSLFVAQHAMDIQQIEIGMYRFSGAERKVLGPDIQWMEKKLAALVAAAPGENDAAKIEQLARAGTLPFLSFDDKLVAGQHIRFNETSFGQWHVDTYRDSYPSDWYTPGACVARGLSTPFIRDTGAVKATTIQATVPMAKMQAASDRGDDILFAANQPTVIRQGFDTLITLLKGGRNVSSIEFVGPARENPVSVPEALTELTKQLLGEARLRGLVPI